MTEKDNKETRDAAAAAQEVRSSAREDDALEMRTRAAPEMKVGAAAATRETPAEAKSEAGPEEPEDDYHELDFSKLEKKRDGSPDAKRESAPAEAAQRASGDKKSTDDATLPPLEIAAELQAQSWKITLVILSASSVLMSLSYTMLIPFLPMYLIQELHVAKDDVNLWSGLIFSVSFLVSGIMAPIWGPMADKGSRKLMAVRSAFLLAISYGLSGVVQDEWQLLGVRCFQGFAAGLWPACLAILSSSVPKEKLGISLGTMQGAMTAGGVLGPLCGGFLAEAFGMRMTFYLGSAALGIITLLIIFCIKEPKKKKVEKKAADPAKPKTNLLKIPVVQRMLFTAGVVQLTILLQQPVMPLYVAELQGSMDRIVFVTGLLFSIVGISGVIASPVWGIVGQRIGFRPALYAALLGSGIFGMVQAIPDTLVPFGAWRFVGGLAFAGIFPAINALLTNSTGPEDRGRIFGLSFAAQQAGSVLGPILGGALAMFMSIKVVIFVSGFVLIPLVAFLYLKRPAVETSMKGVEVKFDRR